jgi:hypothetical protein
MDVLSKITISAFEDYDRILLSSAAALQTLGYLSRRNFSGMMPDAGTDENASV